MDRVVTMPQKYLSLKTLSQLSGLREYDPAHARVSLDEVNSDLERARNRKSRGETGQIEREL